MCISADIPLDWGFARVQQLTKTDGGWKKRHFSLRSNTHNKGGKRAAEPDLIPLIRHISSGQRNFLYSQQQRKISLSHLGDILIMKLAICGLRHKNRDNNRDGRGRINGNSPLFTSSSPWNRTKQKTAKILNRFK